MFKRLLLPDSAPLFTIAAFAVAASIFVTVVWRTLRLARPRLDRFAALPFETATPASSHEARSENEPR